MQGTIDQQLEHIFSNGSTTRRYFLVNKDKSLTKIAMSKVDKKQIDLSLSGGRESFQIISGLFISMHRHLIMLLDSTVFNINIKEGESVGLAKQSSRKPSSIELKLFLKEAFKGNLFFYLNSEIACRENLIRKVNTYDIDKRLSNDETHEAARTHLQIVFDAKNDTRTQKERDIEILNKLYHIYKREIDAGLEVDMESYSKLLQIFD